MTVYKLMEIGNAKSAKAPYRGTMYTLGKLTRSNKFEKLDDIIEYNVTSFSGNYVSYGIHAFTKAEDAEAHANAHFAIGNGHMGIYECVIPRFSKYYLGWECPYEAENDRRHIVSDKLRIIKLIKTL